MHHMSDLLEPPSAFRAFRFLRVFSEKSVMHRANFLTVSLPQFVSVAHVPLFTVLKISTLL